MSVDEKIEEELYAAVKKADRELQIWPQQRTRIYQNIIRALMTRLGIAEVKLERGDDYEKKDHT